ncbi:DDE_Tnp_1_7 domain-containing protein [Trichonephila clavipes]|nr:DDE_Tnp_1_7 domain-containing protein [Trichonephila clavipes]
MLFLCVDNLSYQRFQNHFHASHVKETEDDENTFLLDDELHSDTDTDISSNYLDYSSDDSCSELSSDEDLSSARICTEVDVKNPPVPCPRFKFSGIPSVHVQFDDTSDVLQLYETFIDFSLISKIVEETNKYAKQFIQSSVARQFSKSKFWVETTVEELHVFFALNILQGIDHYWSKRYSTNTPFFSKKVLEKNKNLYGALCPKW